MTTASVCVTSFRLLIRQTARDFTHYKRQNAGLRIVPTMITTFSAPFIFNFLWANLLCGRCRNCRKHLPVATAID
uniref:Uncharacterized protein n=1 Tax=Glossina palpalis gambiensis TaxID=67801 RepID=A0A1B0AVQ8_9MUSC